MPFNISGPFLKEHGLDQLHSQDAIRFQGHTIKLVSNIASPKQESVSSKVYVQGNYTIKPFSVQYVKLSVPEVLAARMPHADGYVTGDTDFMTTTDMHPWSASAVHCTPNGEIIAGIMNTLPDQIPLESGTRYGTFQLMSTMERHHEHPWRIVTLAAPEKNAKTEDNDMDQPTTDAIRAERMQFIIEKFKLSESPVIQSKEQVMQAATLLLKHWHVFSFDGSFGTTKLIRHNLHPGSKPINQRYRPINPSLENDLRAQIDKWLHHKVIAKSQSHEFQPSTEFITAFKDLKSRLLKAPILAYPCFQSNEPFILDTDWSQENNAIAVVLSQKQDGLERVIAYGAKRLTKSQAAYPSTKGELAAAIIFMRHWRYYLQH